MKYMAVCVYNNNYYTPSILFSSLLSSLLLRTSPPIFPFLLPPIPFPFLSQFPPSLFKSLLPPLIPPSPPNSFISFQVFTSWQDRSGSAAAPVSSLVILQLKRVARLLHFCSSRLLFSPAASSEPVFPEQANWFDEVRNKLLGLYIQYLRAHHFEEITERMVAAPVKHRDKKVLASPSSTSSSSPSTSASQQPLPQKLYKCIQRSWSHGIILIELTFVEDRFDVKLFSLESSRLSGQKTNPQVYLRTCTYIIMHMYYVDVYTVQYSRHQE